MKPVIKDIREITDSKEMYENRPHPFLGMFIYILLICLIVTCLWMYFGEIDIVSKGVGVVRPNESMSRIRNKVQGEIVSSYLEEGKYVGEGEVLFTIDDEALQLEKEQAKKLVDESEHKLKQLEKLRDSITQNTNLFSKETEKEYYDRFIKYQQDYESLSNTAIMQSKTEDITLNQIEINQILYENKLEEYTLKLKELEEYKLSIKSGENLFENQGCALSLEFNTYLYKVHELQNAIDGCQLTYDLNSMLCESGLIAEKELEDARVALEQAQNELTKMELQTIGTIETQIKEVQIAKDNAQAEKNKLIIDDTLQQVKEDQSKLEIERFKIDNLVSLYNQIDEEIITYDTRTKELENIELAISDCQVTAAISGTLHIIEELNTGDLIGSGVDIGTIIPENDSMYKVEIFMPNYEIAGINEGDTIKYKFDALPYKEYGQLEGRILNISADASVRDAEGFNGYRVEGSMKNEVVYSYKNEPAEVKVGMTCEAYVITDQKKILYYLLEKINLMD